MTSSIHLQNLQENPLDEDRLKRAAQAVLNHSRGRGDASLTLVMSNSQAVREYNRRHRRIDAATDVLSFPAPRLPDAIDLATDYIGDVLIAYDYVRKRCDARGCCLGDSLCLLVIHGTLHLLGHDHDSAASRQRMWTLQAAALLALGISPTLVQEYEAIGDG